MSISRRSFLSSISIVALAGCGGVSVSQVTSDIGIIAKGVKAILPFIQTVIGINSAVYKQISAIVDEIEALSSATVDSTTWASVGQSLEKIVSLISGYKVPLWVHTVLGAALALVGNYFPLKNTMETVAVKENAMTPAQARTILVAAFQR